MSTPNSISYPTHLLCIVIPTVLYIWHRRNPNTHPLWQSLVPFLSLASFGSPFQNTRVCACGPFSDQTTTPPKHNLLPTHYLNSDLYHTVLIDSHKSQQSCKNITPSPQKKYTSPNSLFFLLFFSVLYPPKKVHILPQRACLPFLFWVSLRVGF